MPPVKRSPSRLARAAAVALFVLVLGEAGGLPGLLPGGGSASQSGQRCACQVPMPCCLAGQCPLAAAPRARHGTTGGARGPAWDACPGHDGAARTAPLARTPGLLPAAIALAPPGSVGPVAAPPARQLPSLERPPSVPPPR
jgi:hypothetical protein